MNRQIRQLAAGLIACYVLLFVALNYWQVGRKQELDAQFDNTRQVLREFNKPRGPIVSNDGIVAAVSYPTAPGEKYDYRREYPTGDLLSNVTGYFTFAFGSTQVEREYGDVLTGSTTEQQVRSLADLLSGDVDATGSVQLALRHDAQAAAQFLLGGRTGSVTVIEPKTGAIRAMYSNPSYDPNTFVNADFDVAQQVITDLQNAPDNPLLANAYQERYMPGSTFKVITTGIGLEAGTLTLESTFPNESQWVPPQTTDPIQNYNGSVCGGGLPTVFARSCNIAFARSAIELGPAGMVAGTEAWGIGEPLPIDLPRPAASTFGNTDDLDQELPLLGIRGFGQSEVQMVPLHMAMVAGAVANGGQMMQPYAVEATFDHNGRTLDRSSPEVWKTPISPANATIETQLMIGVAEYGTASCCIALNGGIPVAAKTGTAELGVPSNPDLSHAWIIAFAPADDPQYAVSVVLTNVQSTADVSATGGRLAGPIAKGMLDFLLTGPGSQTTTAPPAQGGG
ncbi:MAG: penicillin-binding transpeptidase domain-containing protein [Ilumatobacteraceae bacterium]